MESITKNNNTKPNYQYLIDKYTLPEWFDYYDIDWHRYYPSKDGKLIKEEEEKSYYDSNLNYIYDSKKVNTHDIFFKYLAFLNNMTIDNDITEEEMQILLNIKICDYDWLFMWSDPVFDKNSNELLLQNRLNNKNI